MTKHQKHANITRRNNGNYAPHELAFVGVKCSVIKNLVHTIAEELKGKSKLAYLDASHADVVKTPAVSSFTYHEKGELVLHSSDTLDPYNSKIALSSFDLVCINGNHYQGNQQVLFLDKEKEASVKKRLSQLTNVKFVIKVQEDAPYFDFLEAEIPNIQKLPCFHLDDIKAIVSEVDKIVESTAPELQGLVLAGGQSTRMGTDKGLLEYYGKPQRTYLYEAMKSLFPIKDEGQLGTYYSVRQHQDIEGNHIIDKFKGLGPFGGICSAFQENPNTAWLVVATDVPFVTKEIMELLISKRNPSKIATTFKGKSKQFPEPLITIWEPKAYPVLLSYLAQGYSCPRKVLINSDVEIVEIDDAIIRNINTPEELKEVKNELN
ncbi:hypothetical protein KH5_08350 [Urechidicola sp. KH5]